MVATSTVTSSVPVHSSQKQLDEMPAMVMNKYWHQYNSTLPDEYVFHKILREKMASLGNPNDKGQILGALKATWRQFEGLDDTAPDPDVWVVFKAWLDKNMVQP